MKRLLSGTLIAVAACMLVAAVAPLAGAYPGRTGNCAACHNDGSGSLTPSPNPLELLPGENGLLTFDVTALAAPGENNMIALEDLSIAELDASIGGGGDSWTLGTTATKSSQGIGLGPYVLDLMVGSNAVPGLYELNWTLAGSGPTGNSGTFFVNVIPEPATVVLLGLGIAGVTLISRRRRRRT